MKCYKFVVFASLFVTALVPPGVFQQDVAKKLQVFRTQRRRSHEGLLTRIKRGIGWGKPMHNVFERRVKKIEMKNFAAFKKKVKEIERKSFIAKLITTVKIKQMTREEKKLKNKCIDVKRVRRMVPTVETVSSTKKPNFLTNTSTGAEHADKQEIKNLTTSVDKLKSMREKEKLFQGMKNRRAENEADKLKIIVQDLRMKIAEAKASCEPKKRVKRRGRRKKGNRNWGKRGHQHLDKNIRISNYAAKLKLFKKKHIAYRIRLRAKIAKFQKKLAKLKKKCILIDTRFRRSVPASDTLVGNHTNEQLKITKTLEKLKATRNLENKKQTQKEIADASKITSLQGVVATLEKELNDTKLNCGKQSAGAAFMGDVIASKFKRNALSSSKKDGKSTESKGKGALKPTKNDTKQAKTGPKVSKEDKSAKKLENKSSSKAQEKKNNKKVSKAKKAGKEKKELKGKKKEDEDKNKKTGGKGKKMLKGKKKKDKDKKSTKRKKKLQKKSKSKKKGKSKKKQKKKTARKSDLGKYPKENWWTKITNKMKAFWGAIARKFKCVKEGKKCKYGYQMCCGSNLYCNPLLTKSSKTGICTACTPYGESCITHSSCCSKRCIKTKANGKCGPSYKDKKEAAKKRKAKKKKKQKEKKKIEGALTKAAKKQKTEA